MAAPHKTSTAYPPQHAPDPHGYPQSYSRQQNQTEPSVMVTTVQSTQPSLPPVPRKSILEAYLLAIPFGVIGAHHFYLRRPGFGILYMFSFGLLGCGWVFDWLRLPCLVENCNKRAENPNLKQEKRLDDAYILWLPFGLLGFHHFYLKNPLLGVLYFFTFGLLGIGWLVDLFLMPNHVKRTNSMTSEPEIATAVAVILAISPTGLLGFHHFYLNRIVFGLLYMFTFGLLGIGWVVDWFRIIFLVSRYNKNRESMEPSPKTLDDAYVLWFPLGFLGFHHFYLERPGWGLLYLFTFGCFGIGWILDGFRMVCLVKECNHYMKSKTMIPTYTTPGTTAVGTSPGGPYVQTQFGVAEVTVDSGTAGIPPLPGQPEYLPAYPYAGNQETPVLYPPQYQSTGTYTHYEQPPPYHQEAGPLPPKGN